MQALLAHRGSILGGVIHHLDEGDPELVYVKFLAGREDDERRRSGAEMAEVTVHRLPVVGVMGSGTRAHADKAEPLGRWLARLGVHLLTGGGSGVMAAVSRAFAETPERRGWVIGVVPGQVTPAGYRPKAGYPNPWVEIPVFTHLPLSGEQGMEPLSRNHINVLSATVVVALPGSAGTASEVRLALRYGRPLVAWLDRPDQIPGLPEEVPVVERLEAVQAFVRPWVARWQPWAPGSPTPEGGR